MSTNFLIGFPTIPIASTITSSADYPAGDLNKLKAGSLYDTIRTSSLSDSDCYVNFDLGSGNSKAANFLSVKGASILAGAGVYGLVLRASSQSALLPASYSDLKIWWDPTRTISKDSSALVSEVSSLADATLDATATTTARPTWTAPAATMNYNSWLEFDGSTDGMNCDGFASLVTGDDAPYSLYLAYRRDNTTNKDILFSLSNTSNSNVRALLTHEASSNALTTERHDGTTYVFQQPGGTTWTAAVNRVVANLFAGSTVDVYRNGSAIGTGLALNTGSLTFERARLGFQQRGASAAADFFDGQIGEVLAFSKYASSENAAINEYLVTKWVTAPVDVTQDLSSDLTGDSYFTTFAKTSAYRHWWLQLQSRVGASSVACDYPLGRVLLGEFFDIGRDPVFPAVEQKRSISSGSRRASRVIEITWEDIVNEKAAEFRSNLEIYRDVSPVVLYETTSQILRSSEHMHAWIKEASIQRVSHNQNRVSVIFEEAI